MKTIKWDFKSKNWPHIRGEYSTRELKKELEFWQDKSRRRKIIGKWLGGFFTLLLILFICLGSYYRKEMDQWGDPIRSFMQNNWWSFIVPILIFIIFISLAWSFFVITHWIEGESCSGRINCLEWLIKEQDPVYQEEKKERQKYWNKFWQDRRDSGYYNKCKCSCSDDIPAAWYPG